MTSATGLPNLMMRSGAQDISTPKTMNQAVL
jgi:hypothetical protein